MNDDRYAGQRDRCCYFGRVAREVIAWNKAKAAAFGRRDGVQKSEGSLRSFLPHRHAYRPS